MPLPRLQTAGPVADRFLYEINWDDTIRRPDLDRGFDNTIRFKPGVDDGLSVNCRSLLGDFARSKP